MREAVTSIERVGAAIRLAPVDRVPVDLHDFQPAARAMGSLADILQDGERLAEAMLASWREFGHDMILLENGTACAAQACGAEVVYREDAAPVVAGRVIERLSDVERLAIPDPERSFPMREVLRATRILAREIGDRAWIVARADQGPFDLAAELFGMEELLLAVALGEEGKEIHRLLDFCRRVATRYAVALVEAGGRSTSIGDSFAGPEVLSPRHYREYALPYERTLIADLRARGIVVANHICGDVVPIVDDFVSCGAAILEVDHKPDLRRVKESARGKACLLGPIDTGILARGTPSEVEAACREALDVLAPGGGFILGPGCALSPETPADNVHALVESARRYGRPR